MLPTMREMKEGGGGGKRRGRGEAGKDRMGGSEGGEPMHAVKIKQPSWDIQLAGDD